MNRLFRSKRKNAFTLIELLVVIAIIALLAAILAPAVTKALLNGQVTQTVANGRSLFTLLFAKQMDNPLGLATASGSGVTWPATADNYANSSAFFETVVTNPTFSLSYNFFIAAGIRPAPNSAAFVSGADLHNAWCITLDVDDSFKSGTPVLFTQNITLTGRNIDQFVDLSLTARPFKEKAAVVVGYGGNAFKIEPETAIATNFNPTATTGLALYPNAGQL
jgi:prepilin-type N-terminal cleavage/methylation domain-containing protein